MEKIHIEQISSLISEGIDVRIEHNAVSAKITGIVKKGKEYLASTNNSGFKWDIYLSSISTLDIFAYDGRGIKWSVFYKGNLAISTIKLYDRSIYLVDTTHKIIDSPIEIQAAKYALESFIYKLDQPGIFTHILGVYYPEEIEKEGGIIDKIKDVPRGVSKPRIYKAYDSTTREMVAHYYNYQTREHTLKSIKNLWLVKIFNK